MVLEIPEENLLNIFNSSSDGIIVLDENGKIISVNESAKKYLPMGDADGIRFCHETHVCVDVSGKDVCELECPVHRVINSGKSVANFSFTTIQNNSRYSFPAVCVPLVTKGDSKLVVLLFQDTSIESLFQEKLLASSRQDQLTGLSNRQYFDELYRQEVKRLNKHGGSFTGAIVEVFGLKNINDEYGTEVGDSLLKKTGDVISQTLRKVDISCRYSGSKFGIIFIGTSEEGARKSLERVTENIDNLKIDSIPSDKFAFNIGIESANKNFDLVMKKAEESIKS